MIKFNKYENQKHVGDAQFIKYSYGIRGDVDTDIQLFIILRLLHQAQKEHCCALLKSYWGNIIFQVKECDYTQTENIGKGLFRHVLNIKNITKYDYYFYLDAEYAVIEEAEEQAYSCHEVIDLLRDTLSMLPDKPGPFNSYVMSNKLYLERYQNPVTSIAYDGKDISVGTNKDVDKKEFIKNVTDAILDNDSSALFDMLN